MGNFKTLSVVAAGILLGFAGCSSSSSDGTVAGVSGTDVTVERGPIMNALVRDANGQTANVKNKNVYTFADAIKYPITVSGGWIDINGNGLRDANDVDLDMVMKSFIPVVTPLTTMAANDGDVNASNFEEKLQKVADQSGLSLANAKKLPSQSQDVAVVANAIFRDFTVGGDVDSDHNLSASLEFLRDQNITSVEELEEFIIDELGITLPTPEEIGYSNNVQDITLTPAGITMTEGQHAYMGEDGEGNRALFGTPIVLTYASDLNITDVNSICGEDMPPRAISRIVENNSVCLSVHDINTSTKTITMYSDNTNYEGYYYQKLSFDVGEDRGAVTTIVPVEVNPISSFVGTHIQIDRDSGMDEAIELEADGTGTYKNNDEYIKWAVSYNLNGNSVTIAKDVNSSDTITFTFEDDITIDSDVTIVDNGVDHNGSVDQVNSDKAVLSSGIKNYARSIRSYEPVFLYKNESGVDVLGTYSFRQEDSDTNATNYTTSGTYNLMERPLAGGMEISIDGNYTTNNEILTMVEEDNTTIELTFPEVIHWSVNKIFPTKVDGEVQTGTKLVQVQSSK